MTTTTTVTTTTTSLREGSIVMWGSVQATVVRLYAKTATIIWEHDRTGTVTTRGVELTKLVRKHY